MKALVLMAALAAAVPARADLLGAAAPAQAAEVGQDPLMRQILAKQLTQKNGGVTAAVRVASGQTIELALLDPAAPAALAPAGEDALRPLAPAEGLAEKPAKAKAKKAVKAAKPQAEKLADAGDKASWK